MKFILLFFTLCSIINSTPPRHPCSILLGGNLALVGDSRAEQLNSLLPILQPLSKENILQRITSNGKQILNSNQLSVENRAQYGSQAVEWVEKIKHCSFNKQNYSVPQKTLISMGGNDVLDYIKQKHKRVSASDLERYSGITNMNFRINYLIKSTNQLLNNFRKVSLKGFLKSPFKVLGSILSSIKIFLNSLKEYLKSVVMSITSNPTLSPFPDFSTQWDWQDEVSLDLIVNDLKFVIPHFLDQSYNHRVMLYTIQPPSSKAIIFKPSEMSPGFFYSNCLKLFNKMHSKYKRDLFPYLDSRYGDRFVLIDTYWAFLNNVKSSGSYYLDGIHFSVPDLKLEVLPNNTGIEYLARMTALMFASRGWYQSDLHAYTSSLALDIDAQYANGIITDKAIMKGIDSELAQLMPAEPLRVGFTKYFPSEPITITYMGWDFQFDNDKAFYFREGTNHAYMVRGDIRLFYETEGGPDGRPDGTGMKFGYPIEDEIVGSIFESFRSQKFECGIIQRNYFAFTEPYKVIPTPDSPECLAKQERDKNF
jgi:hypothetical protein